ncbi:hypothetical protein EGW08_016813 [Elysia chlorotica]|uniref:Uncharacterized protein n=1 Tax=Elysia chlorotica TaxID=188477 RepID=A0A3S1BUW3_ELYCH|nr:hypothetical protein EGW08_016813 [Elysia chlorotica]
MSVPRPESQLAAPRGSVHPLSLAVLSPNLSSPKPQEQSYNVNDANQLIHPDLSMSVPRSKSQLAAPRGVAQPLSLAVLSVNLTSPMSQEQSSIYMAKTNSITLIYPYPSPDPSRNWLLQEAPSTRSPSPSSLLFIFSKVSRKVLQCIRRKPTHLPSLSIYPYPSPDPSRNWLLQEASPSRSPSPSSLLIYLPQGLKNSPTMYTTQTNSFTLIYPYPSQDPSRNWLLQEAPSTRSPSPSSNLTSTMYTTKTNRPPALPRRPLCPHLRRTHVPRPLRL